MHCFCSDNDIQNELDNNKWLKYFKYYFTKFNYLRMHFIVNCTFSNRFFLQSNDWICVILILCITSCVNLSILVLLIGWVVNWYPKTHLTTELMKPWENCFHQMFFLHLHYIIMKAICCIYFLRLPEEISLTISIADFIRQKNTLNVYDIKWTEILFYK